MIQLYSFLTPKEICININCNTKYELIDYLTHILTSLHPEVNSDELLTSVLEREEQFPTYIGFNCAIPHAHMESLSTTYVVAGSCSRMIPFTNQGDVVDIIFLVVGPPRHSSLHLRLLSSIARILHNNETRLALLKAKNQEEFYSTLNTIGDHH